MTRDASKTMIRPRESGLSVMKEASKMGKNQDLASKDQRRPFIEASSPRGAGLVREDCSTMGVTSLMAPSTKGS